MERPDSLSMRLIQPIKSHPAVSLLLVLAGSLMTAIFPSPFPMPLRAHALNTDRLHN